MGGGYRWGITVNTVSDYRIKVSSRSPRGREIDTWMEI